MYLETCDLHLWMYRFIRVELQEFLNCPIFLKLLLKHEVEVIDEYHFDYFEVFRVAQL